MSYYKDFYIRLYQRLPTAVADAYFDFWYDMMCSCGHNPHFHDFNRLNFIHPLN